ncbi:MAG: Gfo/Idh/MocA family oxidoreductase, partial [Anaerolineae bacterium]|nr:Gfo/Idh/MocA family oxidoreductase [Anaerolineae bacterium]
MPVIQGLGDALLRGATFGIGNVSVYQMRAWQVIPGERIAALANRTRARAETMGQEFGIPPAHVYGDYRELLSHETLDFVDIATAPHVHREQVLAAAA